MTWRVNNMFNKLRLLNIENDIDVKNEISKNKLHTQHILIKSLREDLIMVNARADALDETIQDILDFLNLEYTKPNNKRTLINKEIK
jgi:hypothetical protein